MYPAPIKDIHVFRDVMVEEELQKKQQLQVLRENFAEVVFPTTLVYVRLYPKDVVVPAECAYHLQTPRQLTTKKARDMSKMAAENPVACYKQLGGICVAGSAT